MTGWRGGVKVRPGLEIRTQARRLRAHFASQLGVVQTAGVTQRPGTVWTPTPFWCFGSVAAVATTRRGSFLCKEMYG
jgi:hypothetical protein